MNLPDIMTLEEVSKYLRVSERTIYEWAQKGEIPCGKIGTTWRFKRAVIERWVDQRLGSSKKPFSLQPVPLEAALAPGRVAILSCKLKEDALNALVSLLSTAPEVHDPQELAAEIFRREQLMSTGIGFGVAVPHTRLYSVDNLVMAMGVCREPLMDYESLDGEPVRIVCMIAAGADQHAKHIKVLSALSRRLRDKALRERIIAAPDAETAYNIMTQGAE